MAFFIRLRIGLFFPTQNGPFYPTLNGLFHPTRTPEYIKTLKRMKEYEKEHLRFLTDFKVPFTNNPAENSIRFLKSKKKISGQFINLESGNNYLALQTVIRTATMKKQNALQEIEKIMAA